MMSENTIYAHLVKSIVGRKNKIVRNIMRLYQPPYWKELSEGPELICKALANDDPKTAKLLLTSGFKINSKKAVEIGSTTPLHAAIKKGYVDVVRQLLQRGASITALDNKNNTPFHNAVEKGNYSVVELILNQFVPNEEQLKSYLNLSNADGNTCLHLAVAGLNYEITELLLKNNADTDKQDSHGMTPLAIACKEGINALCELLLRFESDVNIADYTGTSPLHYAIKANNYEMADLLIVNHAYVDKITSDDVSPIFYAAEFKDPKVCELLLEEGATVNVSNKKGESPLHLSVKNNNYQVTKLLLEYHAEVNKETNDKITPLYIASQHANDKMCALLLEFKADPNKCDAHGKSPLHCAVEGFSIDIVRMLLMSNGDVNKDTNDGKTPLSTAVDYEDVAMCELLARSGADVENISLDWHTLLHTAVNRNLYEIVKILLEHNANVNSITALAHETPLRIATKNRNYEMCKLLLTFKADPNLPHRKSLSPGRLALLVAGNELFRSFIESGSFVNKRTTPLDTASKHQDLEMCELLLKFQADPNLLNPDGFSPLHISIRNNNHDIVNLLLTNKADVNLKTDANISPIYLAAVRGHEKLFRQLLRFGAVIDIDMKEDDKTILHYAVRHGNSFMILKILEHCTVDRSKYGDLFKTAVENSTHSSILKLLFDSRFDVSDNELNDAQFLTSLVEQGYLEIFQRVLKRGININKDTVDRHDYCSCRLLHTAVKFKRIEIAKLLIVHGAEINISNCNGEFPLFIAVSGAYFQHGAESGCRQDPLRFAKNSLDLEMVELLLKWGGKVNCIDNKGWTPLFKAVSIGQLPMVKLLLRYGANPNEGNCDKMTALHMACRTPEKEILKLVLKSGADVCLKDRWGLTVVDIYYNFLSYRQDYCEILQAHVVKLKALNIRLDSEILNECTNLISPDFQENCLAELAEMRKEDTNVSNEFFISFYDLFCLSAQELDDLMKEEDFGPLIAAFSWRKKFPIYQGMLHFKLTAAFRFIKQANDVDECFRKLCPSLPDLCVKKLVGYLDEEEIMKLIETFKL